MEAVYTYEEEDSEPEVFTDFSKLIPEDPTPSELCNCWQYIKNTYYASFPPVSTILAGVTASTSDIAVFYYAASGLHHFAKVTYVGEDSFTIDETNYSACTHTVRVVPFSDPNLLGFFAMQ